jgi:hypothetical protein
MGDEGFVGRTGGHRQQENGSSCQRNKTSTLHGYPSRNV